MQTLSASAIKLYQECRMRYRDRYILKIKDPENTSALMGKALHKAIEETYTNRLNAHQVYHRYMVEHYDTMLMGDDEFIEYEPFSVLLKTGRDILSTFPWHLYNPRAQEIDFTVPLFDVCNLHGFIDMEIDLDFVDFKSSKRASKVLQDDIQFIIYAYAYWMRHGVHPRYGIWHHLRTHKQYIWAVDSELLPNKLEALADICRTIVTDTFEDIQPCIKCKPWCKYNVRNIK